jgi:phosphate transport system ATP-binding protein
MVTASSVMEPAPTASAPDRDQAGPSTVRINTANLPSAAQPSALRAPANRTLIDIEHLDFFYGATQALSDINLQIQDRKVTAFIGPSGCGKSTFLRCFNRMNDLIDGTRVPRGTIKIRGVDIYQPDVDVIELRKRVGMVFQKSNPFPKSIYENITYGLRLHGKTDKGSSTRSSRNRCAARRSGRKSRTGCMPTAWACPADNSSGSASPARSRWSRKMILMDEPCSALDPVATAKIEELIQELRSRFSIVIVTHNMQQAARVSDRTAFFYLGRLIEYADTRDIFTNPANPQTEAYVSGRFG